MHPKHLVCSLLLICQASMISLSAQTVIRDNQEENEGNYSRRDQYLEWIHRTKPGTDWHAIERQNMLNAYKLTIQNGPVEEKSVETFANGLLTGEWTERGSKNQAGSVISVDYVPATDKLYYISAGGALWRSSLNGASWYPLNENLQFDSRILQVIPNGNGGNRILTAIGKQIYYSDNEGATFQQSTGLNFYDGWGEPKSLIALNDANNTLYYLVKTWDATPWAARMWLFMSTDKGLTWTQIYNFNHGEYGQVSIWNPYNTAFTYILNTNGSSTLYSLTGATLTTLASGMSLPANSDCQLKGHKGPSVLTFYTLINSNDVYKSTTNGSSWSFRGTLPTEAWSDGIECSLSSPAKIFYGDIEAYRSTNSGTSWTKVNNWWDYYSNVPAKLHADIMNIAFFQKSDGTEFAVINNHGGVSISYDLLVNNNNIGMTDLNVSQYYDVKTDPTNANYVYAGSQDQGFQRASTALTPGSLNFTQVISGDYGHMQFSRNGLSLWIQYPGGDFSYYHNPQTGGSNSGWTMTGTDLPNYGWILPTAPVASAAANEIYVGGGDLNGGSGSHLIKLSALTTNPYTISASQYAYDFRANSNSGSDNIAAIAASTVNVNRLYVATGDGTFFYSNNNGTNWTKSAGFNGPDGMWLYGSCILPSKNTSNLVWFAGSGYSNPAVYKSTDGGQTFTSMSNGLPNTLVQEMIANPAETMIFAATEAGPYVYIVATNTWYPMRGVSVPIQQYYSVEYIASVNTVRFGTYGRGIWDFKISVNTPPTLSGVAYNTACAPNSGEINLTVSGGAAPYTYLWSNGATTQDLVGLGAGTYSVTATTSNGGFNSTQFTVTSSATAPKPSVLNATNRCNPLRIILDWAGPSTGTYELRYRVSGTTSWATVGNVGNVFTYNVSGLAPSTTYQFQIRFVCGTGTLVSGWLTKSKKTPACLVGESDPESLSAAVDPEMTVFPNPADDRVNVSFDLGENGPARITVLNTSGQTVYKTETEPTEGYGECEIDLSQLPQGVYMVVLEQGEQRQIRKLIRE